MQKQLTDEQIQLARQLRGEGKPYSEIAQAIGSDIEATSIRYHCNDVAAPGSGTRTYTERTGKDGRVIRPFTAEEDDAIISWCEVTADTVERGTLAELARELGRKRHSVAARINTLRKHGKLPAA